MREPWRKSITLLGWHHPVLVLTDAGLIVVLIGAAYTQIGLIGKIILGVVSLVMIWVTGLQLSKIRGRPRIGRISFRINTTDLRISLAVPNAGTAATFTATCTVLRDAHFGKPGCDQTLRKGEEVPLNWEETGTRDINIRQGETRHVLLAEWSLSDGIIDRLSLRRANAKSGEEWAAIWGTFGRRDQCLVSLRVRVVCNHKMVEDRAFECCFEIVNGRLQLRNLDTAEVMTLGSCRT